jgi:hypothetical protein
VRSGVTCDISLTATPDNVLTLPHDLRLGLFKIAARRWFSWLTLAEDSGQITADHDEGGQRPARSVQRMPALADLFLDGAPASRDDAKGDPCLSYAHGRMGPAG